MGTALQASTPFILAVLVQIASLLAGRYSSMRLRGYYQQIEDTEKSEAAQEQRDVAIRFPYFTDNLMNRVGQQADANAVINGVVSGALGAITRLVTPSSPVIEILALAAVAVVAGCILSAFIMKDPPSRYARRRRFGPLKLTPVTVGFLLVNVALAVLSFVLALP